MRANRCQIHNQQSTRFHGGKWIPIGGFLGSQCSLYIDTLKIKKKKTLKKAKP